MFRTQPARLHDSALHAAVQLEYLEFAPGQPETVGDKLRARSCHGRAGSGNIRSRLANSGFRPIRGVNAFLSGGWYAGSPERCSRAARDFPLLENACQSAFESFVRWWRSFIRHPGNVEEAAIQRITTQDHDM